MEILVNGIRHEVDGSPDRTLLTVLRDELDLTGTKYGCGEGQCGACTVLISGMPARGCQTRVAALNGRAITTIEGLLKNGRLHPLQEAFLDKQALQCGYCTPGMILSGSALLAKTPNPQPRGNRFGAARQRVPLRNLPTHHRRRASGGFENEGSRGMTVEPGRYDV